MIEIKNLTEKDVGKWVKYDGNPGRVDSHGNDFIECGRLKSWNDTFCFVVFNCAMRWHDYQNYTGQSCDPSNLTFFENGE